MEVITALLIGSLVALMLLWFFSREKRKTLPGPYGLPIVGYIPFMGSQPYVTFQELAKRYGSVFTVQLGSRNVIVLDDFQATKDAFLQDAFMGRPPENPFDLKKATLEEVLEDMVGTFFGAGSETVRLTVDWLALTMAAYPEVQKKVQAEIDNVVGRERMPSWDEHEKLPYTEAVIMELLRWRTIIPINVLRYTLWDTTLNGYFIPKDSIVVANLWSVHHNPKYWGADAETFRPERFLTKDGKQVVKSEYFIPFSIGKRSCPGESYARTEVFLYFTSIFQKFNVSLPEGKEPDFEGQLGIGLAPKPQELCLKLSQEKRKTLPGPYGLPIIGYIPFIGSQPNVIFQELAKHYGSVFT
ncbi:vitamin D 25-hydroxylase [Trichonephila inaurata madagascariensis]|uniref:Vitamin D 25-hydroxylase n=1 Tax=Trichonephila inaurata madagascariensis TaxID=2747483 RepID=A0A8X6YBS9_9ARAC|nr:vitamin D 25-hydroxylase [Trichonephila inaurata madagascariensis]